MNRSLRFALCLAATIFASQTPTLAQTYGPVVKLGMPVDESTMAARRIHYVAPVYSDLARASHIQGGYVAGAKRIKEPAQGIHMTIVNGQVLLEDGKHTGALPGRVLRNSYYKANHA